MSQFESTSDFDELANQFAIVHIHNQSKTYHLTKQILLDSKMIQKNCFFYHILLLDIEVFNETYGSFAYLVPGRIFMADIYLNVDAGALHHIIGYIQTHQIDSTSIYAKHWKTIDNIIDLATMFAMPALIAELRSIQPTAEQLEKPINFLKILCGTTNKDVSDFIEDHKQDIMHKIIKPNYYPSDKPLTATMSLIFQYTILYYLSCTIRPTDQNNFDENLFQKVLMKNFNIHMENANDTEKKTNNETEDVKEGV